MSSIPGISFYLRPLAARPRTFVLLLVALCLVFLAVARAGSTTRAARGGAGSSGSNTIVLEGYVTYYPSGAPASNVSVTLSTSTYCQTTPEAPDGAGGEAPDGAGGDASATSLVSDPVTISADASGHYSFTVEAQCCVLHEFTAVSSDTPDGEALRPGGASLSGCVLADRVMPTMQIERPVPITFDGYIKYTDGSGASGVTVTMKREKYDIGQTTYETKTTGAGGHYQFQSWSRCSIAYEFRPTQPGREFSMLGYSYSGCVLQSYQIPDIIALGTPPPPPPTPTPTPCPTCQCPAIPIVP